MVSSTQIILIVEDEEDLATLLSEGLRDAGFDVVNAYSPSEATDQLSQKRFDLVLLDIRLAKGSGEKVILHMRSPQCAINQATPILVMSGFLDSEMVKRIRAQVSDILVKPFNLATLTGRIKSILASSGGNTP